MDWRKMKKLKNKKLRSGYTQGTLDKLHSEFVNWESGVLKERFSNEIKPQFRSYHYAQTKETKSQFVTGSGELIIERVYTPLDIADTDPIEDIGLPGEYPYTRGRDPLAFRAFNWPLTFYAGFGSAESANERYRNLYAASGEKRIRINMALDLPTQLGLGSDHPMSLGEVGKVGVPLDTVADLERLLEGIPIKNIDTGTPANCIAPWMLAMYYVLAERKGFDPKDMRVQLQNDPFKEYTGRGTYIFSPRVAVDLASDVTQYIYQYLQPNWTTQILCTTAMRWGGCTASQEIGFGIAGLMCYVEEARKKGIEPEVFLPWTEIHMSSESDLFEEVAKFRATRRLWAKLAREKFKCDDPRVLALRLTVYTAANKMTAQEPLNNIVRTTMHVLAAILGGADDIRTPAFDEALALPTFESTRVANLTKQILHNEHFVGFTADPLGGSYYVERLTNQLEEKAREWYKKVEEMGGAIEAVENGFYLKEMANGMFRYQREVESGERTIVGVNKFVLDKEPPVNVFKGDNEGERKQIERLAKVKQERNNERVRQSLEKLRGIALRKKQGAMENIVPAMIEAVRVNATLGEIFGALRENFGEYKPDIII